MSEQLSITARMCKFLSDSGGWFTQKQICDAMGLERGSAYLSLLHGEFGVISRRGKRNAFEYSANKDGYDRLRLMQSKRSKCPDSMELMQFLRGIGAPVPMDLIVARYPDIYPRVVRNQVCKLVQGGYIQKGGEHKGRRAYSCDQASIDRMTDWRGAGSYQVRSAAQIARARAKGGAPLVVEWAAKVVELLGSSVPLSSTAIAAAFNVPDGVSEKKTLILHAVRRLSIAGYLDEERADSERVYSLAHGAAERFHENQASMNSRLLTPPELSKILRAGHEPRRKLGRTITARVMSESQQSSEKLFGELMDYPVVVRRSLDEYRVAVNPRAASSVFDLARVVHL